MNVGRGFRRLFVVLSVAVIGSGIAMDVANLWSHVTVNITLTDGRREVYEVIPPKSTHPTDEEIIDQVKTRIPKPEGFILVPPNDPLRDAKLVSQWPPGLVELPDKSIAVFPAGTPDGQMEEILKNYTQSLPKTFRIVRGPGAWTWKDFQFTPIGACVVVLLWVGFFTVRWVARGFTPQQSA